MISEVTDQTTSGQTPTDADRPSTPVPSSQFHSNTQLWLKQCLSSLLHLSPVSEPSVPDSLCTMCCVHMRFAGSSLSTAEQQGDWSSQSGNRERSPVSEKCKYSANQQPQSRRDRDENNSYYTAPTGREHRGQRGQTQTVNERVGRWTQLFKSQAKKSCGERYIQRCFKRTHRRIERGQCVYMCVYFWMCVCKKDRE